MKEVSLFWVGTNANLFFVSIGALAVSLGLSLWWAIIACVLGNLPFLYVGIASIAGVRAGMPATTFTRAAFGVKGNFLNAFLAWVSSVAFEAINTIFGVYALLALFPMLGWEEPGTFGKLLAVGLQLAISGGIAVLGHATMVFMQRFFAVLLGVVLLGVMVVAAGQVPWAQAGVSPSGAGIATLLTAAGIIASGPISYLYNGPDWVRYLPSNTSGRAVCVNVFWSSFLSATVLCVMGAMLATLGNMSDPVGGMKPFIPTWLFVIYIVGAVGGSMANNVVTYYSSGLALQSMGLPMHRYSATVLDMVVATALILYVLFVQDFTTALNNFAAVLVVWLGPYAGVWICDGFLRRWSYDPVAAHATGDGNGRYWGWNGFNLRGWAALGIGMAVSLLTMKSPIFDGPITVALGGADLNWILGFGVSAWAYWFIARVQVAASLQAPAAVEVSSNKVP